jgi:hypothetical protein
MSLNAFLVKFSAQEGRSWFTAQLSNDLKQLRVDVSVVKSWISAPNPLILSDLHAEPGGFADCFGLSGDFLRLPKENISNFCGGEQSGLVLKHTNFTADGDGHSNTLTVILDTNGETSSVASLLLGVWESRVWNRMTVRRVLFSR